MSNLDEIEKKYIEKKKLYDSLPDGIDKDLLKIELDDLYADYCNSSFKFNCPLSDERL